MDQAPPEALLSRHHCIAKLTPFLTTTPLHAGTPHHHSTPPLHTTTAHHHSTPPLHTTTPHHHTTLNMLALYTTTPRHAGTAVLVQAPPAPTGLPAGQLSPCRRSYQATSQTLSPACQLRKAQASPGQLLSSSFQVASGQPCHLLSPCRCRRLCRRPRPCACAGPDPCPACPSPAPPRCPCAACTPA